MCIAATEMKERITKWKNEKLGAKRKDFVETVKTEEAKGDEVALVETSDVTGPDAMDTTDG